jgi:hypothetical protein
MRCARTDIKVGLRASDVETLGWAAECALAESPQAAAVHLPALLEHLADTRVYRVVQSGGGLIGFGDAGPRELAVGQMAMRAVQEAAPIAANIVPLVKTLVAALNAMQSTESAGLYGDPGTTATSLIDLLAYRYHPAGHGAAIAEILRHELPHVQNAVLAHDTLRMPSLQALARGEVPDPYAAAMRPPVEASAPPARTGRHGLTWGVQSSAPQRFAAHCHSAPQIPMDQLHNGSCNPYRGDTVCTTRLPLLCFHPARRELAITASVMGAELSSRATADAICAKTLGPDWRMAEHHDGDWGIEAAGVPPTPPTRFWVAISDQPANCWDP